MRLRQRTLLSVGATMVCLIGGMYLLSSQVLLQNSEKLERAETNKNLQRVSDEIDYQLSQMYSNASDWSNWDDTYKFMSDHNKEYVKSNLTPTSIQLDLDTMLFLDLQG